MNNQTLDLNAFTRNPGIEAALKTVNGQTSCTGHTEEHYQKWRPVLERTQSILQGTSSNEITVQLKNHTVFIIKSGEAYIGVVTRKADPIMKSLKRMVRVAFRRLGAPVPHPISRGPTIKPIYSDNHKQSNIMLEYPEYF